MKTPRTERNREESVRNHLKGMPNLRDLAGPPESDHPLGPDFDFKNPKDYILMDPKRVELTGPYVRSWFEDDDFDSFCAAVESNQDIGQAIGIRTEGQGMDKRYILIFGMRRLYAALKANLKRIPVRDYGEISAKESLHLQLIENEARADPHPADTAYGFYITVAQGRSQAALCRATGRKSSYVSYMRAVGEAIALLSEAERSTLYSSPRVGVRAFQELAKIKDPNDRRDALLALSQDQASTATVVRQGRRDEGQTVQARETKGGRSLRIQIKDDDIRQDPESFTSTLLEALADEQVKLAERLRGLEHKHRRTGRRAPKKNADPDALSRAAQRVETISREMHRLLQSAEEQ